MRDIISAIVVILAFVGLAIGAEHKAFTADVTVRVTNGQYKAKFYYYYTTKTGSTEHYIRYNYTEPTTMTDIINFTEGQRYKICSKCEAGYYTEAAPRLFKSSDDTYAGVTEGNCKKYTPKDTSVVKALWYDSNGVVCRAELKDKELIFSNVDTKDIDPKKVFDIYDRGCPRPVCKRVVDIAIILDQSSSICGGDKSHTTYNQYVNPCYLGNWEKVQNFATSLIDSFDMGIDAALIGISTFDASIHEIHAMTTDKTSLKNKLTNYNTLGRGTCIGCGLYEGARMLKAAAGMRDVNVYNPEKLMILMTDGSNYNSGTEKCKEYKEVCYERSGSQCTDYKLECSKNNTGNSWGTNGKDYLTAATKYVKNGYVMRPESKQQLQIVGIGVTSSINENEIKKFVTELEGKQMFFKVNDFAGLQGIIDKLTHDSCTSSTETLELCSDCGGFCGCEKTCYCPTCDKADGYCYSISCDDSSSYVCTAKHKTCPNDNKCLNVYADNRTNGCCVEENVDCGESDVCFERGCSTSTGCYEKKKECPSQNPCQVCVGECDVSKGGFTYKSPCEERKCEIPSCNSDGKKATCTYSPRYVSSDPCFKEVCDEETGNHWLVPAVNCTAKDECSISTCVDGKCVEYPDLDKIRTCNEMASNESSQPGANCYKGTCNATTGQCDLEDLGHSIACAACREQPQNCSDKDNKCYTYTCAVNDDNSTFCEVEKNTADLCPNTDPCTVVTCYNETGCEYSPFCAPPDPCHTVECVVEGGKPKCVDTDLCAKLSPCWEHKCNVDTNVCEEIYNSTCPPAASCMEFAGCAVNASGGAECSYVPKNCTAPSICQEAYCDEKEDRCVYPEIKCPIIDPCQIPHCDKDLGCVYENVSCDDEDPCTIDYCVPKNESSSSSSSSGDADDGQIYECKHDPLCTDTNFCNRTSCVKQNGEATCAGYLYMCENETIELDSCHHWSCNVGLNKCIALLDPSAFLDVCGSCVKSYSDDPNFNFTELTTGCLGGMTTPDFAATIGAAAIGTIIAVTIVVVGIIVGSSVIGTRELVKRAKMNANASTTTNPMYEGNETEMTNPMYASE